MAAGCLQRSKMDVSRTRNRFGGNLCSGVMSRHRRAGRANNAGVTADVNRSIGEELSSKILGVDEVLFFVENRKETMDPC